MSFIDGRDAWINLGDGDVRGGIARCEISRKNVTAAANEEGRESTLLTETCGDKVRVDLFVAIAEGFGMIETDVGVDEVVEPQDVGRILFCEG